jgi:predicted Zn-dependent protease
MTARLVVLALVVASCRYPATQMTPKTGEGERYASAVTAAVERGDFAAAHRLIDGWFALARKSGTTINMVGANENLLWIRWAEGDAAGTLAANDAMGDWARRCDGEPRRSALSHYYSLRAWILAEAGRADEAEAAYTELARVATRPGDSEWLAIVHAWLAVNRHDLDAANRALAGVDVAADNDALDLYVLARARPSEAEVYRRRLSEEAAHTLTRAAVLQKWARK